MTVCKVRQPFIPIQYDLHGSQQTQGKIVEPSLQSELRLVLSVLSEGSGGHITEKQWNPQKKKT